jgi:hypothetical protein
MAISVHSPSSRAKPTHPPSAPNALQKSMRQSINTRSLLQRRGGAPAGPPAVASR